MSLLRRYAQLLKGRDRGTLAVTFILSLPILLILIGIIVQFALLANARLTLDRALASAARSAMVALPTDPAIDASGGIPLVERSARMTLESLSPASSEPITSEAATVADALQQLGLKLPPGYTARYTYAQEATRLDIQPLSGGAGGAAGGDYAHAPAPRIRLTVSYDFRMTVPLINTFIGRSDSIAGIAGRFLTLSSSADVQLSPGREAPTSGIGDP